MPSIDPTQPKSIRLSNIIAEAAGANKLATDSARQG